MTFASGGRVRAAEALTRTRGRDKLIAMKTLLIFLTALIPGAAAAESALVAATTFYLAAPTTSYWVRSYNIPEYYSMIGAVIPDGDPEAAFHRWQQRLAGLGAREIRVHPYGLGWNGRNGLFPDRGQSVWEVPTSSVPALTRLLNAEPKLAFLHVNDRTPAPLAELESKREALLAEVDREQALFTSDPVRSFVGKELQVLNVLMRQDQRARDKSVLLLTIGFPGHSPAFNDFPDRPLLNVQEPWMLYERAALNANTEVNLSTQASRFPPDYWVRTPVTGSPLQQTQLIIKVQDVAAARSAVDRLAKKYGIDVKDDASRVNYVTSSPHLNLLPGVRIVIASKDRAAFRKKLLKLGDEVLWSPWNNGSDAFAAAAEKYDLLRAERRRFDSVLEGAPSTRDMIDSELARLRPFAEQFDAAQNREAIVVYIGAGAN